MRVRLILPVVALLAAVCAASFAAVTAIGDEPAEQLADASTPEHPAAVVDDWQVPNNVAAEHARTRWYFGAHQAAVQTWLEGVHRAELARRSAAARRASSGGGSVSYSGVGDCSGFAIPDYIIQRESGGDPWAVNRSSGAFGCAQVMPMHWNGGACADLDRYSIDDQRECVWRLSSGGTNLRPWAATR